MYSLFWALLALSAFTASPVESRILLCRGYPAECAKKVARRYGERTGYWPPPQPAMPGTRYSDEAIRNMLDEERRKISLYDSVFAASVGSPPGVLTARENISNKIAYLQSTLAEHNGISQDSKTSQSLENMAEPTSKLSSNVAPSTSKASSNVSPFGLPLLLFGGVSGVTVAYFYRRFGQVRA